MFSVWPQVCEMWDMMPSHQPWHNLGHNKWWLGRHNMGAGNNISITGLSYLKHPIKTKSIFSLAIDKGLCTFTSHIYILDEVCVKNRKFYNEIYLILFPSLVVGKLITSLTWKTSLWLGGMDICKSVFRLDWLIISTSQTSHRTTQTLLPRLSAVYLQGLVTFIL